MSDPPGTEKPYETSVIYYFQKMTEELAAVRAMTEAQTVAIKAHVDTAQHAFRQEITRTILQLDLNVVELRAEHHRESAELRAAQLRETRERAQRQMENDARLSQLARRVDRNSVAVGALALAIIIALVLVRYAS